MISLWIAFWYFLCLQTLAAEQTEDCLVAVSNGTDGTSVILDCGGDASAEYEALLRGQYLSPLVRSPRALVTLNTTTTNHSSFAIFLPLSNAQGVLELTYNKTRGWAHTLTILNVDCWVISVHKVQETYFTACLDSNEELVMYQLYINNTNLNVSYAQRSASVASGNSFSNIVYAALQDDRIIHHQLFVVVGYHIHSISPLEYHTTTLSGGLPSDNCHTLEYAGDWVLLATCTDNGETYSVYYDIDGKRVLNTTQGTDTVLFLCAPFEGRLTVNTTRGVVLYRNWTSNADTEFILHGTAHSGVCFGNSKTASLSFAYSNDEAGVYAINISHRADNGVHLSSNACLMQNCRPVLTVDKYLVVQERKRDGTIVTQVRDPIRNYSIEFEVNSDVAGVALVKYFRVENDEPHNETNNNLVISIVTLIAVLLGLGSIAIVVSVSVWVYYRHYKHRSRSLRLRDIFQPWRCDSPNLTRTSSLDITTTAVAAEDNMDMGQVLPGQNPVSPILQPWHCDSPNLTRTPNLDLNTTAVPAEDNNGVGSVLPGQNPVSPMIIAASVVVETHNNRTRGEDRRNDLRDKEHQMQTHATH